MSRQDRELSFQKNLNLTSSESGDFKLFIGGLNNKFLKAMQEPLNILQLTLCWQSRDLNMAVNLEEATQ